MQAAGGSVDVMSSKRKVLLVAVFIIIIAGAGVIVAVKSPLFQDIKEAVFAQQQDEKVPSAVEQALIKENEELRARITELEQELSERTHSEDEAEGGTEPNTGLVAGSKEQKEVYKELAEYYANMKPDAAVAILNNHTSQLAAGILHEMEKDQAGEILSRLDTEQAAELIELIAVQTSLEDE